MDAFFDYLKKMYAPEFYYYPRKGNKPRGRTANKSKLSKRERNFIAVKNPDYLDPFKNLSFALTQLVPVQCFDLEHELVFPVYISNKRKS